MKEKIKLCFTLFSVFFKIGLFTFGGGYAMIPLMTREVSEKRKWIDSSEFIDIIAISESTPGPISVNSATYIGYKVSGFWGSFFSTLGLVLPSFVIIFVISLFLEDFLQIDLVAKAFKGINAAIPALIISAGIKLFSKSKKDALSIVMIGLVYSLTILFDLFDINFSTVYYIIFGGLLSLIIFSITTYHNKKINTGMTK